MNLKLKAALLTVATMVSVFLMSALISWIGDTFDTDQIVFGMQCLGLILLTYALYGLFLLRLESEDIE